MAPATIWTIGHSNHSLEHFLGLITAHEIEHLVDVRRWPMSRRNPQFNSEALAASLAGAGLAYTHEADLGGRREPEPGSANTALRNEAFRGYADYMASEPFRAALERVMKAASRRRVALMCAEAVPWRCHRSLIADALTARGVPVGHIIDAGAPRPHALTAAARIEDGNVTYPSLL